jgi:hypothetical protein
MMQLKRDSPSNVVAAIRAIEDRADRCFENLEVYSFPKGLASWAILTSLVLQTEQVRQQHGLRNYDAALINLSLRGALALRWVQEKGNDFPSDPQDYTWSRTLATAVGQTVAIAASYQVFRDFFPMWHQNLQVTELLSETAVRFTVAGGAPARRVSAFQKGFKAASNRISDTGLALTADQARARDVALSRCFWSGNAAIRYPELSDFYQLLFPSHLSRLDAEFRRSGWVDLGPYTLGELKRAYAALNTVFSTHEDFCYWTGQKNEYPVNSCVMVRTRDEWVALVSRVADLKQSKCTAIIDDLTLSDRLWDLHVHPFVQVGSNTLAVAPQFPLSARADENILRVCGYRRRAFFDKASSLKEEEMLEGLLPLCPKTFSRADRVRLANTLPDIDLLLAQEDSQSVIVAELKWLRKPSSSGWKERINRKEDFENGLRQLADIKTFLTHNPDFLSSARRLRRPLNEYREVAFVLIARDFFLWPETDDTIVVDYEVFKEVLSTTASLSALTEDLRAYSWLPVEGKDFRVAFEPTAVNGVMIETETFYRI